MRLVSSMKIIERIFLAFLMMLLLPMPAFAHLVTTGLGPVYDGIGHLVLTFEDLIPVLAIALFVGLRGVASGRSALFLLPLSWFAGGLAGIGIEGMPAVPIEALSFLLLGILIAADWKLPPTIVMAVVGGVGFTHGVLNGVALKGGPGILGLIGIMVTLFVIMAIVASCIVSLKQAWTRIVVRVAGSWIAAIGMLMIGWIFRGQL